MGIVKGISIHKSSKAVIKYTKNKEKTEVANYEIESKSAVDEVINYATNPLKTTANEKEILVSGVNVNPDTADIEFAMIEEQYYLKKGVTNYKEKNFVSSYHIIQSFAPDEAINPYMCHQLGIEMAEKIQEDLCNGTKHQFLISTHMDKDHLHNHIIMSNCAIDKVEKYAWTKETPSKLRKINDDISRKYGLQVILNPDLTTGHTSYKEWLAINEGVSWKDQIRIDIENVREISKNWEDFKSNMESLGYKINEKPSSVTYTSKLKDTWKCRDYRLGEEYKKENLEKLWKEQELNKSKEIKTPEERREQQKKSWKIYVGRYSPSGRRRSDIEILLLIAIKIIKKLKDMFENKDLAKQYPNSPIHKPYNWKLQVMMESLNYVQKLGFKTKEELFDKIDSVGQEISQLKSKNKETEEIIKNETSLIDSIETLLELKEHIKELGITEEDLYIKEPNKSEIRKNIANLNPMPPKTRRKLHEVINANPYYQLDYKFDELTSKEAKSIIAFLEGKTTEKPSILITQEEFDFKKCIAKYEKKRVERLNNLKVKYVDPLTEKQKIDLKEIIKKEGLDLKLSELNQYDGLVIINYYNGKNIFKDLEYISKEEQEILKTKLEKSKFSIIRDLDKVSKEEYDNIIGFLEKKIRRTPNILNSDKTISPSVRVELEELMQIKNETIDFDINQLNSIEAQNLLNYLLNKDIKPEILEGKSLKEQEQEKEAKSKYHSKILDLDMEDMEYVNAYRESLIEIKNYGLELEDIIEVKENYEDLIKQTEELQRQLELLGKDYKDLKRLKYNIELAENVKFTHGVKYEEAILTEQIEEIVQEEIPEEELKEEIEIEKEQENTKKEGIVFETIDKDFENKELLNKDKSKSKSDIER